MFKDLQLRSVQQHIPSEFSLHPVVFPNMQFEFLSCLLILPMCQLEVKYDVTYSILNQWNI